MPQKQSKKEEKKPAKKASKSSEKASKSSKPEKKESKKLAAVRIRSTANFHPEIKKGLQVLKLNKKHVGVVLDDTPSNRGMLRKVKDAVTWGEINSETVKKLESRMEDKKHFRLNPPKGGFERKGIKVPKRRGGALGQREDMNDLLRRML